MNSSALVSLTLLSILLTGCNTVALMQSQLAPTKLYAEGSNIRITMPGDNPSGTYKLEQSPENCWLRRLTSSTQQAVTNLQQV